MVVNFKNADMYELVSFPVDIEELPNGKRYENTKYVFTTGFHKDGNYVILSSPPITKDELKAVIDGTLKLKKFKYSRENTKLYSDEQWDKSHVIPRDYWERHLEIFESIERRIAVLSRVATITFTPS